MFHVKRPDRTDLSTAQGQNVHGLWSTLPIQQPRPREIVLKRASDGFARAGIRPQEVAPSSRTGDTRSTIHCFRVNKCAGAPANQAPTRHFKRRASPVLAPVCGRGGKPCSVSSFAVGLLLGSELLKES
jgi:hypothetical protein